MNLMHEFPTINFIYMQRNMFCLLPSTVFCKLAANQADETLNTYFLVSQRLTINIL